MKISIYRGNICVGEGTVPQPIIDKAKQIKKVNPYISISYSAFSKKADGSYSLKEFGDPNFNTETIHFHMDIPIDIPIE